jgi:hypothetical protein
MPSYPSGMTVSSAPWPLDAGVQMLGGGCARTCGVGGRVRFRPSR